MGTTTTIGLHGDARQLMYNNLEELKQLIAAKLSIEEIMDILGWTSVELVDALEDYIDEKQQEFERAVE